MVSNLEALDCYATVWRAGLPERRVAPLLDITPRRIRIDGRIARSAGYQTLALAPAASGN